MSNNCSNQPLSGFVYSQDCFDSLVNQATSYAASLGATEVEAEVTEGCGLTVDVRKAELESVQRNQDKNLGVTLFVNQSRGNACTSDFSPGAIKQTVQAAYDIACYTAADVDSGLPQQQDIALDWPELDLYHHWAVDTDAATELALRCEQAAVDFDRQISNVDGVNVSAQQGQFLLRHWRRDGASFQAGYASSMHSISASVIAGSGQKMQRDYWYDSMRDASLLAAPEAVGSKAAQRTLRRLNARNLSTRRCAVLFEAPVAASLLGNLVAALSGGNLYRNSSFLAGSVGQQALPPALELIEDPFVLQGKASCPFDAEGVRVQPRTVIADGVIQQYFLSSYAARRLKMRTTGNAGGAHNLKLYHKDSQADDFTALLAKLNTGLLVTELIGQGVNLLTGDYSRGASGFWVENGVIAYPVEEITIAGNLKQMLLGIEAIGNDYRPHSSREVGSILINQMQVGGK